MGKNSASRSKWEVIGRSALLGLTLILFTLNQILRNLVIPKKTREHAAAKLNKLYAHLLLWILGVTHTVEGKPLTTPHLLIANHVGWLDPIVLGATETMLFVTSTQIKNQPVLGTITRLAGCLFVTRTPWTLQEELNEMSSRAQNIPLAIFPEATSGKGHKLLPFRSASFAIATQQGLHVQPVLLRWNNLTAAWYGDMKFAPHLFTILKTRGLNLHVRFLDPVPTLPGTNRKELCARIEASMHAAFNATQP